ncbi:transposase [Pseudoclavibacter helvolus]|uniref:transposase n=1 Tax=Pseudoclavibacter helvolus TaxID=255205 RepID=UPI000839146D|nr:transposase [Pseudoclavibacter helvolus]
MTEIIDLAPIRTKSGPSRPLDVVEGRSKAGFRNWLGASPDAWRTGVQVVAMDGFLGFKSAAIEQLPDAIEVLDTCRERVQQAMTGHRGRAGDPL